MLQQHVAILFFSVQLQDFTSGDVDKMTKLLYSLL